MTTQPSIDMAAATRQEHERAERLAHYLEGLEITRGNLWYDLQHSRPVEWRRTPLSIRQVLQQALGHSWRIDAIAVQEQEGGTK